MSEKTLTYLTSTYEDFQNEIIDKTQKYYPDIFTEFNDASIGKWMIDVMADISDVLRYNIDRCYQETDIDSARNPESLKQIARTNGLKIPGPKCAIVELELSCKVPKNNSEDPTSGNNLAGPDLKYCPIVKRGTTVSNGIQTFEIFEDVDFGTQFDSNGISNRQIIPNKDKNGVITSYTIKKLTMGRAGISKIYAQEIRNGDVKPFMSVIINDDNITNIESILVVSGSALKSKPSIGNFYIDEEEFMMDGKKVQRYFEVDNLIEQYRFGYEVNTDEGNSPKWETIDSIITTDENGVEYEESIRMGLRGKWKRFKNKYLTEFIDDNNIEITFGAGLKNIHGEIPETASEFTQYMMSRMEANDCMGVLPNSGSTMFVLYRIGGGEMTNVGANTVNTLVNRNVEIPGNCDDVNDAQKRSSVRATLQVTNPTPSYGGKDKPSDAEIRYLIKYNNANQNRCVTLKDYYRKIYDIEPKYGCPFRHSVVEVNNKVVIYTLGLDYQGKLNSILSETVANNMKEYLSHYKCINDFIEIRSGKIINLAFDVNVYIDKIYDKSEVIQRIITLIQDYMDIRKHIMGEDIFLGDLEKEISKLDGVVNLISLRCYNKVSNGYSDDVINQSTVDMTQCSAEMRNEILGNPTDDYEIDLLESDKMLYSSIDSMFEIKYPYKDIKIRIKQR